MERRQERRNRGERKGGKEEGRKDRKEGKLCSICAIYSHNHSNLLLCCTEGKGVDYWPEFKKCVQVLGTRTMDLVENIFFQSNFNSGLRKMNQVNGFESEGWREEG